MIDLNTKIAKYLHYQSQYIEQAQFICTPLGKAFQKQTKAIGDLADKQTKPLQNLYTDQQFKSTGELFSKNILTAEATGELEKIKNIEQKINRDDLIYKTGTKKKVKHMIFKSLKQ